MAWVYEMDMMVMEGLYDILYLPTARSLHMVTDALISSPERSLACVREDTGMVW